MGFFDDVSSAVNNVASGRGTGTSLDYLPGYSYLTPGRLVNDEYQNQTNQDQRQKDIKKGVDESASRVAGIGNRQNQIATDFNANKEQYRGLLENQAVKPLRMHMSQKLADTKLDASRRGLLGSGIQQRNAANVVSQYKSDFGAAKDQAANQFASLDADINEAPIKTGLELGGLNLSAQDDYYRAALTDMQGRNAALSGLGQGIGQGAGTYLANRNRGSY